MKKLSNLLVVLVILFVLGFVVVQWSSSPSEDEFGSVKAYADVLDNYNKGRTIDANSIKEIGPNTKVARVTADFFSNLQKIESPLNEKYNTILVAADTSSLLNAEASARNKGLIPGFIADAAAVQTQREALYAKYIADLKAVPIDGLIFPIEPMIKGMNDEKQNRENYKNNMIAAATYINYIIDFVESRRGRNYFTSDGQRLAFSYPDDQKYYDNLAAQLDAKKREVNKFRADLKANIERAVNSLRVTKK